MIPAELFFEECNPETLNLELEDINESILEKLKNEILRQSSAKKGSSLQFTFSENGKKLILEHKNKINFSQENLKVIEKLGIKIQLFF